MQRKEINIFSISFLDLLSGALGAVLILFIIIPKMTSEQQNVLEEIEQLNIQTEELAQLLEQTRDTVPAEIYEQIRAQLENMPDVIDALTQSVQNLQQRLHEAETENAQLRIQTEQQRRELEQTQEQLQQTQERLREAQRQLKDALAKQRQNDGLPSNFVDKGDVQVFILWEEHVDVDLFVENLANGEICSQPGLEGDNVKSWGMLTEDVNHLRLRGDGVKYYEIFYQPRPIPGKYKVWFNIFQSQDGTHWSGKPATVSGFIVMFSGGPNEKRIDFPTVTLTRALEDHVVGTLTVTENNITLEP